MSAPFEPVAFLKDLFGVALAAADPRKTLPKFLPEKPGGRLIVIGAGKAAASMAVAVEDHWKDEMLKGLVVTRYGYELPTRQIEVVLAAHPVPDDAGAQAALRILDSVKNLSADDTVLCLISGGGSALLSLPAPCISREEKRLLSRALLRSGATVHEMNCVRKHLSLIKGGRLGRAAHPARVLTYILSDVAGDTPDVVASGPTLPDPSTQGQALAILERYAIDIPDAVRAYLQDPSNETPKPGDARFSGNEVQIIGRANDSLSAAADYAKQRGIRAIILGDAIQGEARDVGAQQIAEAMKQAGPCVLISGGETTVTLRGQGRGGRNSEYLLAACIAAKGDKRIYGLACDTDGIDGSENNAGAYFTPQTLTPDAQNYLSANDAYGFFEARGSLIFTGPTFTNVNDIRALLVL